MGIPLDFDPESPFAMTPIARAKKRWIRLRRAGLGTNQRARDVQAYIRLCLHKLNMF